MREADSAGIDRRIAYGHGVKPFEPRALEGRHVAWLETDTTGAARGDDSRIARALAEPMGPPLRVLARGARSAAILVPGVDRVARVGLFVPRLLDELRAAGVPLDRTTVHLATGTHRHSGMRDLAALLGDDQARILHCSVHDPDDEPSLVRIGETTRGTPVTISRAVHEADVKILTGRVIPHYFAGFGGGRKALLPGVASRSTIVANHKLTLAPERGITRGVAPSSLQGNPVHEDMLEAMRLARATFALHMLLDTHHDIVDVLAGDPEASHAAACERARQLHQVHASEPFDALVTSAGGAPYDCSFVQALKAIFNVRELVRPGGAVLWIAECPEGILPAFLEWAKIGDRETFERAARSAYNLAAHNTVMLRDFLARARVALVSRLPASAVRLLGLEPMPTLEAGVEWLRRETRTDARVGIVPFANVTHGVVGGG
jgi:nickel-dependent lactate racemase